jgi:hypothetical protein
MSYFRYFPRVDYTFGTEKNPDRFENISVYVDIIDSIKDNIAFYEDYYIQDGDRPDQVSYNLYDTPDFHWTFYLMNNNIREQGWPLTNRELYEKAQKDYSLTTLTTRTTLTDRFKVGQTITGNTSAATATIDHRHLDLGQLVISNVTGTFITGEVISSVNAESVVETIILTSSEAEYLSAHHYENSAGEYVDIDPAVGPGALLTEVTFLDRYVNMNNELKSIKVIKPSIMVSVAKSFREALES